MCDPVIDEHFRRSLGERYTHLFASSPAGSPPSAASAGVGVAAGAADGGDAAANGRPSPPLHAPADSTVNVTGLSGERRFSFVFVGFFFQRVCICMQNRYANDLFWYRLFFFGFFFFQGNHFNYGTIDIFFSQQSILPRSFASVIDTRRRPWVSFLERSVFFSIDPRCWLMVSTII